MKITLKEIQLAVLGGLIAQIVFEAYAWLLSPVLFGVTLEPSNLVKGLIAKYVGFEIHNEAAFAIHVFIGVVGFAVFTLLFYKALGRRAFLSGMIAGVALWFIAQGLLAPALGREFMMGYGPYTQSSFVGHVGMALIIAFFINSRLKSK